MGAVWRAACNGGASASAASAGPAASLHSSLRPRSYRSSRLFQAKELPTFKDNDFINDGQKIHIDENNKKMFLEKLKKDVEVRMCLFSCM